MAERGRGEAGLSEFERQAQSADRRGGIIGEFWSFLKHTRKWWMAPILLALLAVGGLIVLGTTAAAPFLYALF